MKWLRVVAVFALAAGLIVSQNLKQPDIRQSSGADSKTVNEQIVRERLDLVLPDMKVFSPKTLYIESKGGIKKLRFDTYFANIGKGPLELRGDTNEEKQVVIATQIINKDDGGKEEKLVGEFVFHPGHDHWHVDKYAQFQIWEYSDNGVPVELVASTDKFSFCIWDEKPHDLTLENAPKKRQYPRCPKNIQGNSVGWGDRYAPNLEGQEIDITDIENGKYAIISTVNPEGKILESNYENNSNTSYIEINGFIVRIISNP